MNSDFRHHDGVKKTMFFLILTRAGLEELKSNLGRVPSPLWINQGVLSEAEIAQLQALGEHVTHFIGPVDPENSLAVADAIEAIRTQYPGSRVWVEHVPAEKTSRDTHPGTRDAADWKRALETVVGTADALIGQARSRLKRASSEASLMIVPYAGYGTSTRLLLSGRVLRDEGLLAHGEAGTTWKNLVELYKRLASNEIPGARVRARFRDIEQEVVSDNEGYFSIDMALAQPLEVSGWHTVSLELVYPPAPIGRPVHAEAKVLIPPASARFGTISDIDDTVVWTNVTNKLRMLLMLTRSNAYTRKPFKGVAALYRALRHGAGGDEGNPVFYVSSSPWNLYTPLVEFMRVQGIPRGPLFLKDFGDHTIFASRDHHTHKLASIEQILETYPHLPFILIGDSGEQDPEIYSEVVKRYPDRIRVIYIRNVNPDPSRIEAIDRLVEDVGRSGAQLVLAPDSVFAATHAAAKGLIVPTAVDDVRVDKREDEAAPAPPASAESRTD
jgi:phosphatidate phosphatase APP1